MRARGTSQSNSGKLRTRVGSSPAHALASGAHPVASGVISHFIKQNGRKGPLTEFFRARFPCTFSSCIFVLARLCVSGGFFSFVSFVSLLTWGKDTHHSTSTHGGRRSIFQPIQLKYEFDVFGD